MGFVIFALFLIYCLIRVAIKEMKYDPDDEYIYPPGHPKLK